jgi:hypothetical protein
VVGAVVGAVVGSSARDVRGSNATEASNIEQPIVDRIRFRFMIEPSQGGDGYQTW